MLRIHGPCGRDTKIARGGSAPSGSACRAWGTTGPSPRRSGPRCPRPSRPGAPAPRRPRRCAATCRPWPRAARVELVGADHPPEDLLEGARAEARLARRFLGDAAGRRLGELELEAQALEVGLRSAEGPSPAPSTKIRSSSSSPRLLEQHHRVEAREELRAHAVLEEVLVLQPVAQRELQLLAHPAALDHRHGLQARPCPGPRSPGGRPRRRGPRRRRRRRTAGRSSRR